MNRMPIETKNQESLFICYGKLNPKTVVGYHYVILESSFYKTSEIQEFKENNKKVFAYLSLGEVNKFVPFFNEFERCFVGKNNHWNSYLLDLSNQKTISVLTKVVRECINLGFDGIFFDNLDNFGEFGTQKNQKNQLIGFINTIKLNFPMVSIIQNSGLEFVHHTHKQTDAILTESVFSSYDFEKQTYILRSEDEYKQRLQTISDTQKQYKIPFLIVEYANSKSNYFKIKELLNTTKIPFFIGNIDLQTIPSFN